ncbi:MarR family winged helix-turn-helix transcriptional regulator [Curtobacterium sp. MCBD17_035]|uniref:MarR family winged helix-turn-helix transcriptional regulator n=1 Tax=Curtobacterium sp. MCBD17_035 TaxID=2175673 RepID=UPI000DAAD205|nr:MarR family winged helix-turn-helix transcriptional regulator [Curtobacterium sp. MCBD17_035]WIB68587.1 MarR family winged helix-turn-helix transcriptional regulator [Curtobacterium sp. MCBD17_035]
MEQGTDRLRAAEITRAYRELARITRRAAVRARGPEAALSIVDHSLVDFVAQHYGCMAIDIARYLRLNRSTISRQLSGLLAAGLIEQVDGGTGNAKPLAVTAAGEAALERSVRVHRESLEERLASWSDDDVALLAGLLERLNDAETEDPVPVPDIDDDDLPGAAAPMEA